MNYLVIKKAYYRAAHLLPSRLAILHRIFDGRLVLKLESSDLQRIFHGPRSPPRLDSTTTGQLTFLPWPMRLSILHARSPSLDSITSTTTIPNRPLKRPLRLVLYCCSTAHIPLHSSNPHRCCPPTGRLSLTRPRHPHPPRPPTPPPLHGPNPTPARLPTTHPNRRNQPDLPITHIPLNTRQNHPLKYTNHLHPPCPNPHTSESVHPEVVQPDKSSEQRLSLT